MVSRTNNREALIQAIRELDDEELITAILEMVRYHAHDDAEQMDEVQQNPKLAALLQKQVLEAERDFEEGNVMTHDQVLDWAKGRLNGKEA